MDLKATLASICDKWKYKLDEISPGIFRIDVMIPMKEGSPRYQFVYVWEIAGRHFGKPCYYFNSRCGEYTTNVNLYKILVEAGYGNYTSVTVTTDKRADGSQCETIVVQAAQPIEFTNETILNEVLYEVAYCADIIEEKHFGGDKN